jgi:hypothetical protein
MKTLLYNAVLICLIGVSAAMIFSNKLDWRWFLGGALALAVYLTIEKNNQP